MGTTIRAEVSTKNRYYLDKHRYYELKHFCLQYPEWKKLYSTIDSLSSRPTDGVRTNTNVHSDPTFKCAELRSIYRVRIEMIEQAAIETDSSLYSYILKAVTEGLSYPKLKARLNIPCSRDAYYDLYRRFFWLLNEKRN